MGETEYGGTDIGYNEILQDCDMIAVCLESFGIRVNPSCRFSLFRNSLTEYINNYLNCGKQNDVNNLIKLSEGIRDYFELKKIVNSKQILTNQKRELQILLSGAQVPSEDNLTLARDIQFQLYSSSFFDNPNMSIVFEEPDFRFCYRNLEASVAAKRLSSDKKIFTRVKEAEKQIINCSIDGFIAISIERLVRNGDNYIVTKNPDNLAQACERILYMLLQTKTSPKLFDRDKTVIGIIVFVGIPAFVVNNHIGFGYGSCIRVFPTVIKDDPRHEIIKEIAKELAV